jgi:ubiquitin-conjugating enzyme E2 variant
MNKQSWALTSIKYIVVVISISLTVLVAISMLNSPFLGQFIIFGIFLFVVGYCCADLLTGTIHWFCDTFFSENTPLIGKTIIESFREHHTRPHWITKDRFIEQDSTSFFVLLPLLLNFLLKNANNIELLSYLLSGSVLVGLCVGAFGTNLFHKWAHSQEPPVFAIKLQTMGLILTPKAHKKHHNNHSKSFCVTSGWLNPMLDYINFFHYLENFLRFLFHAKKI